MKHSPRLLLTATAACAAVALSACGTSSSPSASTGSTTANAATTAPPASSGAATVHLAEWKIDAPAQVAAGKVAFTVDNTGQVPHEMVVIKTDKPAGGLGSGNRISEDGSVGEAGDVAPGKSKSVTLDLQAGHYVLVCNLPGHYKLGMHAELTVR